MMETNWTLVAQLDRLKSGPCHLCVIYRWSLAVGMAERVKGMA